MKLSVHRVLGVVLMLALPLAVPSPGVTQDDYGFRFVRIQYGEGGGDRGGGGRFGRRWGRDAQWAHDYPTADLNFHIALERTTKINVDGEPLVLTLEDDRIFEHPVLYLCEPGYWVLEEKGAENLREYLARGGFILFDDFRGRDEWTWFYNQMKRVVPDLEPVDLPADHPIWSIYFDIDPDAAPSLVSGLRYGEVDHYRAYFDNDGRMIALACYNQDIGDGWEWPEENFENASTLSFQMGINFLIYAMTH